MPCYHPLKGYRSKLANPSGKRSIVFNLSEGYKDLPVQLPCGQCIGCRLEHSRRWAIRCLHESKCHEENAFITLTYDEKNIPPGGTLVLSDFQKFMKRLRKEFSHKTIKFFHCGEYGEKLKRPHYHACLFGVDFPDKYYWKNDNGNKLYRSPILEKLWTKGQSLTGEVTFESAAYVARYITKKISGRVNPEHYQNIDEDTGEIFDIKPEYVTMSRRPGIGKTYFEKFKSDCYPSDYIIVRGKKCKVPKYYDQLLELEDPLEFKKVSAKRKVEAQKHALENTPARLQAREDCQIEKYRRLKRSLEDA